MKLLSPDARKAGDDPERAQSMIAGVAFFLGGLYDKRHIKDVGGYATFGALYFLVGGILLTRKISKAAIVAAN